MQPEQAEAKQPNSLHGMVPSSSKRVNLAFGNPPNMFRSPSLAWKFSFGITLSPVEYLAAKLDYPFVTFRRLGSGCRWLSKEWKLVGSV
jgi:hypothetical protein